MRIEKRVRGILKQPYGTSPPEHRASYVEGTWKVVLNADVRGLDEDTRGVYEADIEDRIREAIVDAIEPAAKVMIKLKGEHPLGNTYDIAVNLVGTYGAADLERFQEEIWLILNQRMKGVGIEGADQID